MVKLKAYATIEALISSVLILSVFSIGMIIVLNVMTSSSSTIKHIASQKLIELALKREIPYSPILLKSFKIKTEIKEYHNTSDILHIEMSAIDNNGTLIEKRSFLKKKK